MLGIKLQTIVLYSIVNVRYSDVHSLGPVQTVSFTKSLTFNMYRSTQPSNLDGTDNELLFSGERALALYTGLYLECSGWGCNGIAGGLGNGSPPAGSSSRAPVAVCGQSPQKLQVQCNIVPIKTAFCASFVCISLLKHALKLKRHTVDLLVLHTTYSTVDY